MSRGSRHQRLTTTSLARYRISNIASGTACHNSTGVRARKERIHQGLRGGYLVISMQVSAACCGTNAFVGCNRSTTSGGAACATPVGGMGGMPALTCSAGGAARGCGSATTPRRGSSALGGIGSTPTMARRAASGRAVQVDIVLKALVFHLLESTVLSSHRFQISTCTPTVRHQVDADSPAGGQRALVLHLCGE